MAVNLDLLTTVPLVGTYHVALFSDRSPIVIAYARPGKNKSTIEMRLRSIENVLTVRLSVGTSGHARQTTFTVPRLLKRLALPVADHGLVSLDTTCSVSSMRWIPMKDYPVMTRWLRSRPIDAIARAFIEDLGAKPMVLRPAARATVAANDALLSTEEIPVESHK